MSFSDWFMVGVIVIVIVAVTIGRYTDRKNHKRWWQD